MPIFEKNSVRIFRFVRCALDAETGIAQLVYAFDDGPELIETITVPGAPFVLDTARAAAAEQALRLLHLIAGVSYYKAAVPPTIAIDSYSIDADTAALLETIYLNGLGEFAYRNGLNLHGKTRFPVGAE
ncbi:MAG: endonuclease domain-containing protein, partial [Lysobacteraceae bacterium]